MVRDLFMFVSYFQEELLEAEARRHEKFTKHEAHMEKIQKEKDELQKKFDELEAAHQAMLGKMEAERERAQAEMDAKEAEIERQKKVIEDSGPMEIQLDEADVFQDPEGNAQLDMPLVTDIKEFIEETEFDLLYEALNEADIDLSVFDFA